MQVQSLRVLLLTDPRFWLVNLIDTVDSMTFSPYVTVSYGLNHFKRLEKRVPVSFPPFDACWVTFKPQLYTPDVNNCLKRA